MVGVAVADYREDICLPCEKRRGEGERERTLVLFDYLMICANFFVCVSACPPEALHPT